MGLGIDEQTSAGGLASLFGNHRAELLRFLAARCGDAIEAQDLLQELWLKASAHPGGPIANPRAYLFRMANNLVLDQRRARMRAMRRDHAWVEETGGGAILPEDRSDPALPADEDIARRQEVELLRRAISGLPPGARQALQLVRLEGLPQSEAATVMGISRSGIEKHLAVAMKRLKIAMADCGFPLSGASGEQGLKRGDLPPTDKTI